jgi:hypothetical protein
MPVSRSGVRLEPFTVKNGSLNADPGGYTTAICETFGYDAVLIQRGEKIAALAAIAALGKNTSWGTNIETRNVLFLPR